MNLDAIASVLLSLTTLLSGISAQINNIIQPQNQMAQVVSSQSVSVLQPSDFVYEGYRNIRTNGEASTYGRSLTHRYVNGELRFLTIAHPNVLHEFKISNTALGGTVAETTNEWTLPSGVVDDFTGIWFEQDKNRLWVTRTLDYGEASAYYPTRISVMTLGSNGAVSGMKTFSLSNIPSKQVFGGAQKLPSWAQQQFGCGPYIVGWGGYTSLVDQTSKASVGPAMFCIPDPDTISNGATLSTNQYKTLLSAVGDRGYRLTAPINEVDEESKWRNKTPEGYSYWTWSDSYYNTGMWIEGSAKRGYVTIGSFGKGRVRYADGGVQTDGQNYELHIWNPTRLGNGLLTRPDYMYELNLPKGNNRSWTDYGVGKVTGATYDSVSGKVYVIGFPFGSDDYTGRLYSFSVNVGTPNTNTNPTTPTTTTPTPTDAVVSAWSAWSDTSGWTTCSSSGTQTKTQTRTRTVITSATNGGTTPTLSETQTVSQSCTIPTTPTPTAPDPKPVSTTPNTDNKFVIGDSIKTTTYLSVRVSPGGSRLTSQRSGSYGTIVDGPTTNGSYIWWKVNYNTGSDGWSVQNYLEKVASTPTVPTTPTTTTPTPTDAVVSAWSAWSDTSGWTTCSSSGTQTKTQTRTRTVITSATNGGTTPTLSETQTVSQSCVEQTQTTSGVNSPTGYTICSGEGGTCNISGVNNVAYGANGVFTYKDVTGSVYCDNSVFGDPIQNEYKYCSVKNTNTTVSPANPTPTTPSVPPTSTPISSITQISQNLYFGLSNSQVKILQDFLIEKGYLKSGLNTGYFGYSTLSAVRSFQKANGISATGYVGTQTRALINSSL